MVRINNKPGVKKAGSAGKTAAEKKKALEKAKGFPDNDPRAKRVKKTVPGPSDGTPKKKKKIKIEGTGPKNIWRDKEGNSPNSPENKRRGGGRSQIAKKVVKKPRSRNS
jgi:hypothetical protein